MVAAFCVTASLVGASLPTASANLAFDCPAKASSVENDEHAASRADDDRTDTGWTADDEPEGTPDWWQVDLGGLFDLGVCDLTWPFDGMNYRYKVEGSADGRRWQLLSDQTATRSRLRRQRLTFDNAHSVRYLRITITGFDDGCCAGINDVQVFGTKSSPAGTKPSEVR